MLIIKNGPDSGTSDDPEPVQDQQPKAKRAKPLKVLPTERIAFQKQLDMLRAYAVAFESTGQPVQNQRVATLMGIALTTVPHANPFFADTGLLQRTEGGYVPSEAVMNYNRSYAWNPETAAEKLGSVLRQTWFAATLLPRLAFRGFLEDREALAMLADASGSPPTYRGALQLLLEYMKAARLIEIEGGVVKKGSGSEPEPSRREEDPLPTASPHILNTTQLFPPGPRLATTEQHLLNILDPEEMSEGEQDAVWTLLKYLKKKGRQKEVEP